MMFLEQLKKFKLLMNAVQASSVTPSMLSKVLALAGFQIDETFLPIVAQVIASRGAGKTLFDLIEDEDLIAEVEALLNINATKVSSCEELPDTILLTSAIRCPHCYSPFAIRDAFGLQDHLKG